MRSTVLMVTHDNRILDLADRILTLEDGSVEENHRGLERVAGLLEDADMLNRLTLDRGPMMESLRARHFERKDAASRQVQDYCFDISNLFARLIYFLHVLAGHLADLERKQKLP